MERVTIPVAGMSCGHCVAAVKEALARLDGVQAESVSIGSVTVAYDAATASVEKIAEAIAEAGYTPQLAAAS